MNEMSVVIPVGPAKHHCQFLQEAMDSIREQRGVTPSILLVDDMHDIPMYDRGGRWHGFEGQAPDGVSIEYPDAWVWRAPWHMGVAHAFNCGVATALTELVLLMGADDTLEPDACEKVIERYNETPDDAKGRTYYGLSVRYMDTGETQDVPCGAAAVTRTLWRETGGFPIEAASGASDAAFLSQIWWSDYFRIDVLKEKPLYNVRRHANQDTAVKGPEWQGVILNTRDLLTQQFQRPDWGRYEP